MKHLKESFLKVYANTPLGLRDEIILVFDKKPISWNVAYIEVKADTDWGENILKELKELDFI